MSNDTYSSNTFSFKHYKDYNAVVVFVGTNYVGQLGIEKTIEQYYRQILTLVNYKSQIPKAALFVLDILPRCKTWDRDAPLWETSPLRFSKKVLLASCINVGVRCIVNYYSPTNPDSPTNLYSHRKGSIQQEGDRIGNRLAG